MSIDSQKESYRQLAADRRLEIRGGRIPKEPTPTGGGGHAPGPAVFLPPPPEEVPRLLEDLLAFSNGHSRHQLTTATISEAASEAECSFSGETETTGRSLSHFLMRRFSKTLQGPPPVSLVLASRVEDALAGRNTSRYIGRPNSLDACEGINRWTMVFACATRTALQDARRFERRVNELQAAWLSTVGNPNQENTVRLLVEALPAAPSLTAVTASELTGRTFQAANIAISQLVNAGILVQTSVGKRNRTFEAPELVDAYSSLEEKLGPVDIQILRG